jgi:hypothetical protein
VVEAATTTDDYVVTINLLPDDLLLGIFDFCVRDCCREEEWKTLVHVCRRWRAVVFLAPRRLNLRIVCTPGTLTRSMLDIWSSFPTIIHASALYDEMEDDFIATFESCLKFISRITRTTIPIS